MTQTIPIVRLKWEVATIAPRASSCRRAATNGELTVCVNSQEHLVAPFRVLVPPAVAESLSVALT